MNFTIEELEREAAAKEAAAQELRELAEELRAEKAKKRLGSLDIAARSILSLCADAEVVNVHDGDVSGAEDLPSARNEITLSLDSVRERKGYIDSSGAFDTWNRSYHDQECVKLTVLIPRDVLESNGILPDFRGEVLESK